MHLANPHALFLLGLIPIVVLIHSLKPRSRQVEVSSLFLWQEAMRERAGGLRIRRIIRNVCLLLQIAAVLAAVLALSDPLWPSRSVLKGDVILVLDSSASMKARTEDGVRFDRARAQALRIVQELPKGSRMLVLEAGGRPLLRSPFTQDKEHLRRVVQEIQPTDVPGDLEKAVYLALSFVRPDQPDRILVITDGAGRALERLVPRHPKVEPVLVEGGSRNVGITRFAFRKEPDPSDRYEVLLEIRNFNPHPVLCPIRLAFDGKDLHASTVGLKALEKKTLIFPYSGLMAGTAEAYLDLKDDFPTDNRAWAVLNPSEDIWVLLVTRGNFFLEKLLEAYPNVKVNSSREIIASSWAEQARRHDIVILDRTSAPPIDRGNYLLIRTLPPSIPLERIGEVEDPQVLDWDRLHPVMRGLDLGGLRMESAMKVKARGSMRPILEAEETGLMYAYESGPVRAVWVGFDLTRSDLPLRVAFPVMMSNVFNWLYPHKLRFSSHQVQAGTPFPIYLEVPTEGFSVRRPSGRWEDHRAAQNPYVYSNTNEVGVYLVAQGKRRQHFAANLVDEAESDIRAPHTEIEGSGGVERPKPEAALRMAPLWPYLLVLGCMLLLAEWWAWCGRP